ncbi:MAG: F0F1 ATP synthase subunit A [Gemmataceae bacterium]|nr:F0F1 ATP synthase subunit A [Gemmataceae bacterium]
MAHGPYDPKPHHEVQDQTTWEFFEHLFVPSGGNAIAWPLPKFNLFGYEFQVTKFMILELVAAVLIIAIYLPLARAIRSGGLPRGRWWNFFEVLLVFIRDQVARPSFAGLGQPHGHGDDHGGDRVPAHGFGHDMPVSPGHAAPHDTHDHKHHHEEPLLGTHPGDAYVPFLWTIFLFVLFCNLLGMIPTMGSPTASIWVTGGLAGIVFIAIHFAVLHRTGLGGFAKSLWPHVEMPPGTAFKVMGFVITALLAVIEFFGIIIKAFVLAVRLFANMIAGHMVLANIMLFVFAAGKVFGPSWAWGGITVISIFGVVMLSLLELFVAFLQAYVFTFLTALFMGMQLAHAEHH